MDKNIDKKNHKSKRLLDLEYERYLSKLEIECIVERFESALKQFMDEYSKSKHPTPLFKINYEFENKEKKIENQ